MNIFPLSKLLITQCSSNQNLNKYLAFQRENINLWPLAWNSILGIYSNFNANLYMYMKLGAFKKKALSRYTVHDFYFKASCFINLISHMFTFIACYWKLRN